MRYTLRNCRILDLRQNLFVEESSRRFPRNRTILLRHLDGVLPQASADPFEKAGFIAFDQNR